MIRLKSPAEIEMIRASGVVVARAIRVMAENIVPGKTTTAELDAIGAEVVHKAGGTCSFFQYRGFPAHVCISVNEEVIHGIPGKKVLREGDIVDLDIGVYLDGYHADGAWTYPVGEVSPEARRLLNVTRESLYQAIAKARIGNKLGDIGFAVQKYVEANRYGIVRDMVGHGIGRELHEEPSIPNYGKPGHGTPLKEGMTLCIEPMINEGTGRIRILDDGWTVVTEDGKRSAHFEHTVAITKSGPDILTLEPAASLMGV
jgi:methionyl aminopeptidase